MNESSLENSIIKRTVGYLIIRDIWLFLLISAHILFVYKVISRMEPVLTVLLCGVGVFWVLLLARLLIFAKKAGRDTYLKTAFKDEFFTNIKTKSGYNGFIAVSVVCMVLVLLNIASVAIPTTVACESVFFTGVFVNDISCILQSRG